MQLLGRLTASIDLFLKITNINFIIFYFISLTAVFNVHSAKIVLNEAESLEYFLEEGKQVVRGKGRVKVTYKEGELTADEIIVYPEQKDVIANGNVVYREHDTILNATRFIYNFDTQKGILTYGRISTPIAYITGKKAYKTGSDTYEIHNASYTTCKSCIDENKPPDWQVRASSLKIRKEGYAHTTAATLNVLDFPVFYSPVFLPVKTKRQTGFLMPEFMSTTTSKSTSLGLGTDFFWAVSRSKDATFSYRYEPDHGHKMGLEYRYVLKVNERGDHDMGKLNMFFINDHSDIYKDVNINPNNDRWAISFVHAQDFKENFRFRANGAYLSDQQYLTHFKGDIGGATSRALRSSAQLIYNTENAITTLDNSYYYHLGTSDQKDVPHKLPQINYFSTTAPIYKNLPAFYSFNSHYIYFAKWRNRLKQDGDASEVGLSPDFGNDGIKDVIDLDGSQGNNLVDSGESKRGHRLIVVPEVFVPFRLLGWVDVKPRFSNNAYFYVPHVESKTTENIPFKYIWEFNLDFLTNLAKTYMINGDRYKHKIIPEVRYLYKFGEYKKGFHPYFDSFDESGGVQKVAFAMDNLFIGGQGYQELFQLYLEQRINIEYWIRSLRAKTLSEQEDAQIKAKIDYVLDPFKIVFKLNFRKIPSFISSVTGRAELYYDHYGNDINRISSQIKLSDSRGDSFSLTYTKDTRPNPMFSLIGSAEAEEAALSKDENIHYLKTGISIYVNKNYTLTYQNDYSIIQKSRHLDQVGLKFTPDSNCWLLNVKYQTIVDGRKDARFNWAILVNLGIMKI